MSKRKALSLISGGLDSMLAAKVIMEQDIHVEGINFFIGFAGDSNHHFKCQEKPVRNATWVANKLGIKLHIVDAVDAFKPVLLNPQYGYGAHLNPCLDCKLFMVQQAKQWMDENDFDFLITGEVLGQRPKSQRKDTLPIVAKNTDDRLLRPLSAKLLPPTFPEREGWVKRELLYDINGRSRKPQIELAAHFGFDEFPQPAGGCVLTDENYCERLKDFWLHRGSQDYTLDDILLLRVGRHLRPRVGCKLIVGRDEVENNFLENYKHKFITLHSVDYPGALVLFEGVVSDANINIAASFAAYFSKGRSAETVEVLIEYCDGKQVKLKVKPGAVA